MSIATDLLKASHIGIRDLKEHLSSYFKREEPLIITSRGKPHKVILSYIETLELLDIIDEATDPEAIALVKEGREAIKKGAKGIPVSKLFSRIRKARK